MVEQSPSAGAFERKKTVADAVTEALLPPDRLKPDQSTPQRKWAAKHLRGLMNLFLPSFHADMVTLDEEAIRHDVNHAVAQGFAGTMPMINWTPPGDPRWEQLYRIVIDEAAGRLPVHGVAVAANIQHDRRIIASLERLGVELLLLASPYPSGISETELYDSMAARIKATELPVMLYAALGEGRNFRHLGPAGQPLGVYDRLADLPNVTAVKISQPVTLISTMQLCAQLGDRLSMGPVNLDFLPLLARHFDIGWSGQWNAEAVQTPANQLGNRLLAASAEGRWSALDETARKMQPVLDKFFTIQADVIRNGGHPWAHMRYYSWLGGGNGGLLPTDPHAPQGAVPTLDDATRHALRAAFLESGLAATDTPDEQFPVGRAAWKRGERLKDLGHLPHYTLT